MGLLVLMQEKVMGPEVPLDMVLAKELLLLGLLLQSNLVLAPYGLKPGMDKVVNGLNSGQCEW